MHKQVKPVMAPSSVSPLEDPSSSEKVTRQVPPFLHGLPEQGDNVGDCVGSAVGFTVDTVLDVVVVVVGSTQRCVPT